VRLSSRSMDMLRLIKQLDRIEEKVDNIMSGLTDLNTTEAQEGVDITTLVGVVQTLVTDLQAALANTDSDAAVEAASQIVAQQDAQLQQITAQLKAADPGSTPAPSGS
jgi:tetrahydromethanopterin S-methyltransferase subunit G